MESIEVKFDLRRSKSVNSVTEFQHILWEVKFKHKFYFVTFWNIQRPVIQGV